MYIFWRATGGTGFFCCLNLLTGKGTRLGVAKDKMLGWTNTYYSPWLSIEWMGENFQLPASLWEGKSWHMCPTLPHFRGLYICLIDRGALMEPGILTVSRGHWEQEHCGACYYSRWPWGDEMSLVVSLGWERGNKRVEHVFNIPDFWGAAWRTNFCLTWLGAVLELGITLETWRP